MKCGWRHFIRCWKPDNAFCLWMGANWLTTFLTGRSIFGPMEGTTDINYSMDSLEVDPLQFKENDHLSEQTRSYNLLESPPPATIPVINWSEHISRLRSTEFNLESLVSQSVHCDSESLYRYESSYNNPPSNYHRDMVKELTLRNYKSPSLSVVGCYHSEEDFPQEDSKEMLDRTRSLLSENSPTFTKQVDAGNSFLPQVSIQTPPLSRQFGQNFSELSGLGDKYILSDNHTFIDYTGAAQDCNPQDSGFELFSVTNALKGKGVASRCPDDVNFQTYADQNDQLTAQTAPVGFQRSCVKSYCLSPLATISESLLGIHEEGISLRSFLKPQSSLNKVERLHMFKLIVDLISSLHSQGFFLKHLCPSHFVMLQSKQVKYVGPLIPQGQMELLEGKREPDVDHLNLKNSLKRRWNLVDGREFNETLLTKHQKVCEQFISPSHTGVLKGEVGKEFDPQNFQIENSICEVSGRLQTGGASKSHNFPVILELSSGGHYAVSDVLKLEERWYASPEELNEGSCSSSSNIYSLGVLLFELFCHFESQKAHCVAMSNLHHRILPPSFLSEHPKEAGICLWMLHPDPSSRPKISDILLCDIFRKDREASIMEQLSTSVDCELSKADLLLHFLLALKEKKDKQTAKLMEDLGCVKADLEEIKSRHFSTDHVHKDWFLQTNSADMLGAYTCKEPLHVNLRSGLSAMSTDGIISKMKNFGLLETAYFSMSSKSEHPDISSIVRQDIDVLRLKNQLCSAKNDASPSYMEKEPSDQRGSFFEGLRKYARYKRFEVHGSLRYTNILNSANVICSLSFDQNEEYFAAAGASKKIKVFEFGALINSTVDIHYPVIEMPSKSKHSCVCWNGYIRNYLASTDYGGVVQLWDASTGQGFHRYSEHQKRAWSVDFSSEAPTKLASGSDDCSVKLWSIHEKNCIKTIKNVANVCCVQFSSHSSHLLGFGSADYRIYCYDLRNTRIPWCTLAGHGKTVSYIKFLDCDTIVSASTDNTLKLWDLKKTTASGLSTNACSLTMTGHTNEKNFVGLSVCDGYVLCGSETNEVYAYQKTFPMPITSHKFGYIDPITGHEIADDNGQFVSSVCWKRTSNMALAANSSGCIKLLQMV
nr:PREDICTED: protein SPA1-RELATED 2-like isoform X2 [Musa acuminata subsp. malaccensis]